MKAKMTRIDKIIKQLSRFNNNRAALTLTITEAKYLRFVIEKFLAEQKPHLVANDICGFERYAKNCPCDRCKAYNYLTKAPKNQ